MKIKYPLFFILMSGFIAFLSNAQVILPHAFWKPPTQAIEISDGTSYNYGSVSVGLNNDKTFVVSNTSTVNATSMTGASFSSSNFTWAGGTYPGGGTCGATLGAGSSCTIKVRARSATATSSTSMIRIDYFNSMATTQATREIKATFTSTPSKLIFVSPPEYFRVSTCTPVTLQTQDDGGNPVNVGSNTTINLTTNNSINTLFYTTNTCGTTATTRTITSGTNSVTFYIRSSTANQSGVMVATAIGLETAEANFLVTTAPTRLFIVVSPQIKLNVCREITVYAVDNNFVPVKVTANTPIGGGSSGSNGFFTSSTCATAVTAPAIPAGSSSTSLYTRNNVVQTVTLTAVAGGLTNGTATVSFVSALTWWNASWGRRTRITINNADQAVPHSDIPILVRLDSSVINYSQFQASGADIRFVAADNTTVLPFQIDNWDPDGESQIWVRVPSIAASSNSNHIFMYYGNPAATDAQNGAATFSKYWSTWHLNEDMGNAYLDSVGGRHGSPVNSPARVRGVIGYAASLLGAADGIDISANLATALGASSTMSFWMKTDQIGNNSASLAPGVTGVNDSTGTNDIFLGWLDAAGNIGVSAGSGAGAMSAFSVNNNAWRHVTLTRDSISGTVQLFINGVLSNTATSDTGNKTTYFNRLGEVGDTGGSPINFNGVIDEVRIYNTVQTADQILADFKYMMDTHILYSPVEVP